MGEDNLIMLLIWSGIALLVGGMLGALWTEVRRGQRSQALTRTEQLRSELSTRGDHYRFAIADLDVRIAAANNDNRGLKTEIKILKQTLAEKNETLNLLWSEGLELKRDQSELETKIADLEHAIDDWKQRLLLLQQGIDTRARNAQELERELNAGLAVIDEELDQRRQEGGEAG